ncbi:MAG: sugar transferase, partial [Steroidobacteraceae bacterium]
MTAEIHSGRATIRSVPRHAENGTEGEPYELAHASGHVRSHLTVAELHLVDGDVATQIVRSESTAYRARQVITHEPIVKRIFDIVGAIGIGILFSPFILAVVLIIRLGGQPVLFKHKRVGRLGRVFNCLKFRTMVPNAEQVLSDLLREHPELRDEWTQNHKLRTDPRITAIGRFLRRTSLDELPQLWNVIRGDMSLVGPRPVVRVELLRYGRQVADYLAVRPGLTGLWQIKGRSDTTYRRRVAMDKYYVRNHSLLLDMYVVAVTVAVVLRRA